MLDHLKINVKNGLPNEVELTSFKPGEIAGSYFLNYGRALVDGTEYFIVEPKFELIIHNAKYGFFAVENIFSALSAQRTELNVRIAYSAIDRAIKTLNTELPKFADILCAADSYQAFICPDFKSLSGDIAKMLF